MTDRTVKKKSQHFWGEAETNTMLDILREIDIMKFVENEKTKTQKVKQWQHAQLLCCCYNY